MTTTITTRAGKPRRQEMARPIGRRIGGKPSNVCSQVRGRDGATLSLALSGDNADSPRRAPDACDSRALVASREPGDLRALLASREPGDLRAVVASSEPGDLRAVVASSEAGDLCALMASSELVDLRALLASSEAG